MKSIITLLALSISSAALANTGTVRLTHGGSYEAADGTKITCTGTTVKKDVACYCDRYNYLMIVRTTTKGTDTLDRFGDDKEACLKAVRTRPDCN